MSDFTQSTLTSPRSPLFSDSDPCERQSGSEIVTSDEEPDLGAFTAVLRAWGYLQPPPRIPTHFLSSSSSRTRSTPTTITGYPGFGGGDSESVEESTVWNRILIQSYFRASVGTDTSSGRTERTRPLFEEPDDEEYSLSLPPSPAPESALTVEITSDAASLRSTSYEDGVSGENLVVPIATPPSIDGRVSFASRPGSHTHFTSLPSVQRTSPLPFGPHLPVANDNTPSVLSSASSIPSQPYSISNQVLNDNTTISPSTLSIVSQMSVLRTRSSVFQETPSPTLWSTPPFQETRTSSSPADLLDQIRPSSRRVISNSSHAESDIINSYYREPGVSSPSTDEPALDFPWSRRSEIIAQPPPSGLSQQPLLEQGPPRTDHPQTPSVIDDNSSTSAVTEETPPPSATTSPALSVLQEIPTARSESLGVSSSHSLTPLRTIVFSTASTSTSTSTTTSTATVAGTANPTRQPSMEPSTVHNIQYPSLTSTCREQQPRNRGRIDFTPESMQMAASRLHYHRLSSEGDLSHEQPSLGYLDEALSFIAAERARLTATREAGMHRGPSPPRDEEEREEQEEVVASREGGRWGYAIEPQRVEKLKKRVFRHKSNPTIPTSTLRSLSSTDADSASSDPPRTSSSSNDPSSLSENVVILNSPNTLPKKVRKKNKSKFTTSTSVKEIKPISILKRTEGNGNTNTASSWSTVFYDNSFHNFHSHLLTHTTTSTSTHAHAPTIVGPSPPRQTKFDGAATPRAHSYLYTVSSDKQGSVDDEEGDEEGEEFTEDSRESHQRHTTGGGSEWYIDKYGRRSRRSDAGGASGNTNITSAVHKSMPDTPRYVTPKVGRSTADLSFGEEEEEEEEDRSGDYVCGDKGPDRTIDAESSRKKEKKKKKAKKRKIPVTVPIPISTTLSHSQSVPNLRAEAGNTTDSSSEENGVDSGAELPGPGPEPSLSSASFPEGKKWRGEQALDPFAFRGDPPSNIAVWPVGKVGFMQSKRARLVALAQNLQSQFPKEEVSLRKVIRNLDGNSLSDTAESTSNGHRKKKKKKSARATLLDDCSLEYSSLADSDLQRAEFGEEDPDPRGDVPGKNDTLVHVFIDHSNILIGFLNHIKRKPKQLLSSTPTTTNTSTTSRPLPIPKTKAGVPILDAKPFIPLPSFATANFSCSAPSTSLVKRPVTTSDQSNDASSDGDGYTPSANNDDDQEGNTPVFGFEDEGYGFEEPGHTQYKAKKKKSQSQVVAKRAPRNMWHAALTLILERGRPVTRRVVAASRPLHQPMETIERLGYEVKIFMRVPDLGDGADRLEKTAKYETYKKDKDSHNSSPTKRLSSPNKATNKTHARRISGQTNGEMGLGTSGAAASSGHQSASTRVKYREQGVDELLQLKLHLAITAPDEIPEGATIILATGDGNVGQFNEDGFLGAVRTALKRGWRVELYAWEDCLSRSWRREFGPSSEWGRKGMFRIITLDQFAECLVELGG